MKERLGGRLRLAISGGAPLSAEIAEFFHAIDILLIEGYGLTECTTAASTNTHEAFRFGTVGRALPGTEVKLAEDGELLIRSETVFQGYYKDPEATAEVLDADGWLRSGDIAAIDEDGFITITDRKKDIIVTAGGKNVAPQNLENDLKASKFVSQAMVVGDRQPYVAALITLDPESLPVWAAERGLPTGHGHARADGRGARARPGDRRRRQRRPLALRADQALRDPAARLHDGRRRADADAEAEAARRRAALRRRARRALRGRDAEPGGGDLSLNRVAFRATVHCLTGCAIGEVLGMVIGTALGWGDLATIALAVALAFFFGYSLTMLPLLRAGLALGPPSRSRSPRHRLDRGDGDRRQRDHAPHPGAMEAGATCSSGAASRSRS